MNKKIIPTRISSKEYADIKTRSEEIMREEEEWNVYNSDAKQQLLKNDAIDSIESGFMEGYEQELEFS